MARKFTGSSTSIRVLAANAGPLRLTGNITISLVAKFGSLEAGTRVNPLVNIGGSGEGSSTNYLYAVFIDGDKKLRMFWETGSGTDVSIVTASPAPIDADKWHHFLFQRDIAENSVRFYVDGTQVSSASGYSDGSEPTGGGDGIFRIGSYTPGATDGGNQGFVGSIAEVAIWNEVVFLPLPYIHGGYGSAFHSPLFFKKQYMIAHWHLWGTTNIEHETLGNLPSTISNTSYEPHPPMVFPTTADIITDLTDANDPIGEGSFGAGGVLGGVLSGVGSGIF